MTHPLVVPRPSGGLVKRKSPPAFGGGIWGVALITVVKTINGVGYIGIG